MASDIESRVMSLTRRYGFKPTRVIVRGTLATILFENQKGEASRYVSQLKPAMKQMGVPENAMKSREVSHPAEAGLPAEHVGVVEIDFGRMLERASCPGAKDTMASHKESFQKEYILWALPKGETDRLHERPIAEGITTPQQMDDAKRKAASQGWHGFRVQILDMSKPFRWMSRPGAKDKMAVEDRFYFGK